MPFDGSNYDKISPVTQMLTDGKEKVQRGWCQHIMRQRGSACMIGSLAIDDFDVFAEVEQLMLETIHDLGYSHSSVANFNDDLYRTKQQVLEVYDRAIESSTATKNNVVWLYREAIAA